ncbi:hypothetical protein CDV36_009814 [Fusarium kuroshium]|uniref:BZIP domain-containing protein n=1 Tax=Fusarium kuroshium TaxID=2010991 RepID=A0A3M2RZ73_9HYPO|nr:hypothetical protein CDV36_009814 [Fusarium kuroshium]
MPDKSLPTKRRGRPSTNTTQDVDEATLKARRERNREAQNIFRRRRQAAEAAQAKRVRRLEEVVEEMSSIFMAFVDEVLETEAVLKSQPVLVGSLRRSMARILKLAHEVVGPDDGCEGVMMSALPTREKDDEEEDEVMEEEPARSTSEPLSTSPDSNDDTTTTSDSSQSSALTVPPKTPQHSFILQDHPFLRPSPPPQPFAFTPSTPIPIPPQIFENGWLGTTPATPMRTIDFVPSPSSPLSQDSFTYRLARASLTVAYLFLSNDPHIRSVTAPEARLFSNPLRGKARDEMLTRLRWLLGPGRPEMYRVVDLPYGRYGPHVYSRAELNPQTVEDVGWPWPSQPAGSQLSGLSRFFSIIGVEKQLLALGARVIDHETLELNLTSQPFAHCLTDPSEEQPESWSFVNCFSFPAQQQPKPKPKSDVAMVRLSAGRLVSSLALRAVCLMRGPGFPRDEIGSAIEEAIITT